jgi:hypothetical protein
MKQARRLLSAVLTLALAHFGVVATAPAHAHEVETPHGVHAATLHDHVFTDHDYDDRHEHADARGGANDGDLAGAQGSDADGTHTVFHVHCCPHFAPVDPGLKPSAPMAIAARLRPPDVSGSPTASSAPPFRPPRTFL